MCMTLHLGLCGKAPNFAARDSALSAKSRGREGPLPSIR